MLDCTMHTMEAHWGFATHYYTKFSTDKNMLNRLFKVHHGRVYRKLWMIRERVKWHLYRLVNTVKELVKKDA